MTASLSASKCHQRPIWLPAILLVPMLAASAPACLLAWPGSGHRLHGQQLFVANGCLHCHQMQNRGGHKGPDLTRAGHAFTRAQLRAQIEEGGNGMPAFRELLAPHEMNDLVAYLHAAK